jgi:hypothetical protein
MTTAPVRTPPMMQDRRAEHQIRLALGGRGHGDIIVSCNCGAVLETRSRWGAGEAHAVWAAHMAGLSPQGATLAQEKEG